MSDRRVLFPELPCPMMETNAPARIESEMPASASVSVFVVK